MFIQTYSFKNGHQGATETVKIIIFLSHSLFHFKSLFLLGFLSELNAIWHSSYQPITLQLNRELFFI